MSPKNTAFIRVDQCTRNSLKHIKNNILIFFRVDHNSPALLKFGYTMATRVLGVAINIADAMKRERLTLERIRRFAIPSDAKQVFLWDTEVPRLAVRATVGAKSFIFESKLKRQTIRITIGDVLVWKLDEAREEARRLQTMLDQGIDPRQEKKERIDAAEAKREAERRLEKPAIEAWKTYIEARRSKWGELTLRDHERMSKEGGEPHTRGRKPGQGDKTQPGVLRPLLMLPLAQIDASRIYQWLTDEGGTRPAHTSLAYRLLRAFLNWCSERPEYAGQAHPDACKSRLVRDEVPKKGVKDDCLQREQLESWFLNVLSIPNPTISAYLQTTLLTGARREEVASLQWTDVDFQWNTIRIADKVDGARTIPLTPYVAYLLADLKSKNETPPPSYRIPHGNSLENDLGSWQPSRWVFASPSAASGRLQEPRVQHKAACKAAGIEGLTIHGLRRSFGTLAEWVEVPAGVVAQIQGHKPSATAEKHYRRRPIDLLRLWHTRIEEWILEQAQIR